MSNDPVSLGKTNTRNKAEGAIKSTNERADIYADRASRFTGQARLQDILSGRIAFARMLVILITGYSLYLISINEVGKYGMIVVGVSFLFFLALVFFHRKVKRRIASCQALATLNRQAISRLERNWNTLPSWVAAERLDENACCRELNISGHASLLHLLDTIGTARAQAMLVDWLNQPAQATVLVARQEAVQELSSEIDFRQRFYLKAAEDKQSHGDENLIDWAESEVTAKGIPAWLAWGLTSLSFLFLVYGALGLLSILPWMIVLALNAVISLKYLGPVHTELDRLEHGSTYCRRYAGLIEYLLSKQVSSVRLQELCRLLGESGARNGLRRIERLVYFADLRYSGLTYLILQLVCLWSFHVHARLQVFKLRHGAQVRQWLDAIAEYEVLANLAVLDFDNPDWCYPEVDKNAKGISAKSLGHPLLSPDIRVDNDIEIGGKAENLVLLSGSNMSGKSTLLRSVGLNLLLAASGGPVCARALRFPPLRLHSCFGSHDSLADNISLFMAELCCLAQVKHGIMADHKAGLLSLFLLDEILRGTNSHDRHEGAIRVLVHMLRAHGVGLIATHDLALAEHPEISSKCASWHLEEVVEETSQGVKLKHSYRLEPGVATKTNALRLLEEMGFSEIDKS